jgi:hypothetical protein
MHDSACVNFNPNLRILGKKLYHVPMRPTAVFAVAASLLATAILSGCSADPKAALVGNYKGDANSLKVGQSLGAMEKMVKSMVAKMELKLSADGTFAFGTGTSSIKGKWDLADNTINLAPDSGAGAPGMKLKVGADKQTLTLESDQGGVKASVDLKKTG